MRKALLVLLGMFLLFASSAYAFNLREGYEDYTGPIMFKFSGYSSSNIYDGTWSDPAEDSWGVGKVIAIVTDNPDRATIWGDGDNGEELVYYMGGIKDVGGSIVGGVGSIFSTGGLFSLYLNDSPTLNFNTSNRSFDKLSYTTVTDGTPFARFSLMAGLIPTGDPLLDPIVTLNESFYSPGGLLHGDGFGYGELDTTWGWSEAVSRLNSNAFAGGSDVSLQFNFVKESLNGFNVRVDDPVRAVVTPEPISFVLMGLGLSSLGLGAVVRKKKKA